MHSTTLAPQVTKRWWALTWTSITQLMMVVVATVMNCCSVGAIRVRPERHATPMGHHHLPARVWRATPTRRAHQ